MNIEVAFDLLLMLCSLILAWMSIFSTSLFRCIVFFVCLGLLMTIAWGQMGAFDVAIAEAAIGAGLTGALLLAAWNRIRPETVKVSADLMLTDQDHQEGRENV
ncbi:MAG: putative MnhB-related membrane protein [Paraglaciecola sp.]|jgi:uncharacterized MnhB-related membrane protein